MKTNERKQNDDKQSDLEHRPYRFWDDMWNETDYNYLDHAESD